MRGIKLTTKDIHAIIKYTPKIGVKDTAKMLGRTISSIYYVNSITKKYGYALVKPKRLTTKEKVESILKKMKLI